MNIGKYLAWTAFVAIIAGAGGLGQKDRGRSPALSRASQPAKQMAASSSGGMKAAATAPAAVAEAVVAGGTGPVTGRR